MPLLSPNDKADYFSAYQREQLILEMIIIILVFGFCTNTIFTKLLQLCTISSFFFPVQQPLTWLFTAYHFTI